MISQFATEPVMDMRYNDDKIMSAVKIMGIVNVTPDSFSDGGRFHDAPTAIAHGLALAEEGADILDIGGESTRPGAEPVSDAEELDRVMPVIEGLAGQSEIALSIDTRKPCLLYTSPSPRDS